ncbi:MAG TPA: BlaI/MecI/CopY family transcriptional regulator [Candidatus Andersenbacteria bacterium]|nr:BlaI/MecI/CopY family transcriptional regulator [Candidatus Andersenbacteria bacterium]
MTRKLERLLGLSQRELRVLKALRTDRSTSVTNLTQAINPPMPRTTVAHMLKKLQARSLAAQVRVGGHHEWQKAATQEVTEALRKIAHTLEGSEEIGTATRVTRVRATVATGKRGIKALMKKIITAGRKNRVFIIQGNKSAEYGLQRIPSAVYREYHEQLRHHDVIIEGIAGEKITRLFKTLDAALLQSHLNRLVVAYLLPDRFMEFDLDVAVFGTEVAIIHWQDESVTTIESKELALVFKHLIGFTETHAKKVDLNASIKSELQSRVLKA